MSVIEKISTAKGPLFTFELLPPLKGHSIERTYAAIDRLIEFNPAYINFTSHRNETTYHERPDGLLEKRVTRIRPGTIALAAAVKYKYNITVVPHILCGGFSKEETENVLIEMNFLGIDDVLALRGDLDRIPVVAIRRDHITVWSEGHPERCVKKSPRCQCARSVDDG